MTVDPLHSQVPPAGSEEREVVQAIKDYIEGYYLGSAARVRGALHPELAKRSVHMSPEGKEGLAEMTTEQFTAGTANQDGPRYFSSSERRLEITVFEIDGNIATAKSIGHSWVDYIHLCRLDGKWRIVNVVWKPL